MSFTVCDAQRMLHNLLPRTLETMNSGSESAKITLAYKARSILRCGQMIEDGKTRIPSIIRHHHAPGRYDMSELKRVTDWLWFVIEKESSKSK